jgi:hypothetical protein
MIRARNPTQSSIVYPAGYEHRTISNITGSLCDRTISGAVTNPAIGPVIAQRIITCFSCRFKLTIRTAAIAINRVAVITLLCSLNNAIATIIFLT